jgi:hypothetical protein
VALNYVHPQSRRTDGAGGDDGKDVHFPGQESVVVFQLKSCTGRMDPGRWQQVKRSLERAAELNPEAWHLVLPIDFTPAEEKRFAEITARFSFPCDYMGPGGSPGEGSGNRLHQRGRMRLAGRCRVNDPIPYGNSPAEM